jgi:hypothetical protein
MNRNFLVKEDSTLKQIQALIFSASINYYVKQWVGPEQKSMNEKQPEKREGNSFLSVVSDDYWNQLEFHNSLPNDDLLSSINAIQNRDWSIFAKKNEYQPKKQLVGHCLSFFNELAESHKLSFEDMDSSKSIEEILLAALIKDEEHLRNQWLESLKSKFSEPSAFVSLLVNYPLNADGLTFMKIRSLLTEILFEEKIVDSYGIFVYSFIESLDEEKLEEIIHFCVEKVVEKFGNDSKTILAKMSTLLINRGKIIIGKKDIIVTDKTSWHENALKHFFIDVGAQLGKLVDIEFYNRPDGSFAHTKSQFKSKIFVNRKGHLARFIELCTEDVLKGKVTSEFMKLVTEMIDTIAHEIVHLNEGVDCNSTHDKRFYEELSKMLAKLFIFKESLENSSLALLKKHFPEDRV